VAGGGVVLVRGVVKRLRIFPGRLLDVFLEQDGALVRARWFRPPRGMQKGFVKGATVTVAGPLRRLEDDPVCPVEIVQASIYKNVVTDDGDDGARTGLGVRARYPSVPGIGARILEKIIAAAVDRYADLPPDILEVDLRARLGFPALADALHAVHARGLSLSDVALSALASGRSPAHRRLAFEDLLILQVGFSAGRRRARAQPARACAVDLHATLDRVRAALPFVLTGAQARAIAEIARDLAAPRPMQRLLIGDVGSGKTAVAFAAAALVAAAGGQTLLMAPTEVLVEQHLRSIGALAAPLALGVARLTASMSRVERAQVLARCRGGAVQILIGTQSLLDPGLAPIFPDLRLAIVDEQHRFGVAQRARLRGAGGARLSIAKPDATHASAAPLPHLLVMSATPIPRTLALTLYGDLDATLLTELPPGRQPTGTEIYAGDQRREQAYQRLADAVAQGRQAFVVCPIRDQGTRAVSTVSAVARHRTLRRQLAPAGVRVGLLHGALDAPQKDRVLRAFAAGDIQVLVATTVIELGIDVANATVMLVEQADRFGLAQLHQLRGRVGRGLHAGACLLCTGSDTPADAAARLTQLVSTTDGFRIAEADLSLRGHGDLFGARQAGAPRLRFTDVVDYLDLLELARAEALRLEEHDPDLTLPPHRALRDAVASRWVEGAVFGEETG
jgi:ATP-dependent DNA helicase RecG